MKNSHITNVAVVMCVLSAAAILMLSGCVRSEGREERTDQAASYPLKHLASPAENVVATSDAETNTWNIYCNAAHGYAVQCSEGWDTLEAVPRTGTGTAWANEILIGDELQKVTFLERRQSMWPGEFQIAVMANPDHLALDQWVDALKIEDVTGGDLIQERNPAVLGGMPAVRLSIFGFDHEEIAVIAAGKEGCIYYISFAGTNPNDPQVDQHRQIYERMLESFRFVERGSDADR